MKKEKLDVLVMFTALIIGGYFSAVTNPVMGIALLLSMLTVWALIPKIPALRKVKVQVHTK